MVKNNLKTMSLPIHICLRRMTVTSMDEDSNPLLRFKFGPSETGNKCVSIAVSQIRIIHIRMVISGIYDFTLVSKHSTKLP